MLKWYKLIEKCVTKVCINKSIKVNKIATKNVLASVIHFLLRIEKREVQLNLNTMVKKSGRFGKVGVRGVGLKSLDLV